MSQSGLGCSEKGPAGPRAAILIIVRVKVAYFGVLRDLMGCSEQQVELPDSATAGQLFAHLQAKTPALERFAQSAAMAVNLEYVKDDRVLRDGDEVAMLPPVSGGLPAEQRSAHCAIVETRIVSCGLSGELRAGEDGAVVLFEGVVRNNSRGRRTLFLEYQAYPAMALREMELLAEQALRDFQIRDVRLVHRTGRVEIGETSVLIAVAAAHRGPAFEACRWLIDTLKRRVPVWKKEYFEDGAVWADGEPFPPEIPMGVS